MTRPPYVINLADLPGEKRPRFTSAPGIAAVVRSVGDATGLTHMGVHVRSVEPGFAGTHRHFHTVEEEWSFVLSGRGMLRIGPLRLAVRAGHFAAFPPGPRPHHFLAEGDEPLVFLEGGERRPSLDACWYPDARMLSRGRARVEPYEEPPPEEGDAWQLVHIDDLPIGQLRALHQPTGLERQAVYWASIPRGARSIESTDAWTFILSGRGIAHVGIDRFEIGPNDFVGHPAGSPVHLEALEDLTYLTGGTASA
jgi:uncharacterized cupin superfamily protein